jgi:hypothetical protein
MNKTTLTSIAITLVLLVALGGYAFPKAALRIIGAEGDTNFTNLVLSGYETVTGTSTVTGLSVLNGGLTIGSGGATVSNLKCSSFTYDPASFSSSTDATTTVAVAGPVVGDYLYATFDSATSSNHWSIRAPQIVASGATASATVALAPIVGSPAYFAGLNLSTSTLKVCYIH